MTESKLVGRFVGIGVGPGPAQLISVAAWEELQCCDLICYPRATSQESSAALRASSSSRIVAVMLAVSFGLSASLITPPFRAIRKKIRKQMVRQLVPQGQKRTREKVSNYLPQ